jgi:hypothetical protein
MKRKKTKNKVQSLVCVTDSTRTGNVTVTMLITVTALVYFILIESLLFQAPLEDSVTYGGHSARKREVHNLQGCIT